MTKIGFEDKNGKDLCLNDWVKTYDSTGQEWQGKIVRVSEPFTSPIKANGGIQCAFKSNYDTWIVNQEYASELEIMSRGID